MSAPQTPDLSPTQTLANNSRAQLEPWLEEFEAHARNLCAQHDVTGALTLVASDLVWQSIPANQTSATSIAAGNPPFRAHPTWDQPAPQPATPTMRRLLQSPSTKWRLHGMRTSAWPAVPSTLPYWPVLGRKTGTTSKLRRPSPP